MPSYSHCVTVAQNALFMGYDGKRLFSDCDGFWVPSKCSNCVTVAQNALSMGYDGKRLFSDCDGFWIFSKCSNCKTVAQNTLSMWYDGTRLFLAFNCFYITFIQKNRYLLYILHTKKSFGWCKKKSMKTNPKLWCLKLSFLTSFFQVLIIISRIVL